MIGVGTFSYFHIPFQDGQGSGVRVNYGTSCSRWGLGVNDCTTWFSLFALKGAKCSMQKWAAESKLCSWFSDSQLIISLVVWTLWDNLSPLHWILLTCVTSHTALKEEWFTYRLPVGCHWQTAWQRLLNSLSVSQ